MATLTDKTIASTYTSLLKLEGDSGSTVAGASGNAVQVKTGDNDATTLYLNTDRIGIGTAAPAAILHVVTSTAYQATFDSTHAQGGYIALLRDGTEKGFLGSRGQLEGTTSTYNDDITLRAQTELTFSTGGSNERMVILADGNVGIGIVVPTAKLHAYHNTSGEWAAIIDQDHATGYGLKVTVDAADGNPILDLESGSTTVLRVEGNGNVGIGTTSPAYKMQIKTAVAGAINIFSVIADDDGHVMLVGKDGEDDGYVDIYDGAGNQTIHLDAKQDSYLNGGNVGIGTASPDAKLHIFKDLHAVATSAPDASESYQLFINGSDGSTGDTVGIALTTEDTIDTVTASIVAIKTGTGTGTGDLTFMTRNGSGTARRMTIDEDGNVGIGTVSPAVILDVAADLSGSNQIARIQGDDFDADGEYTEWQAISNRSGGGSVRGAAVGSYNNTGVAQTAGFLSLMSHDGVTAYLWLDEDDDLQVSHSVTHIGTTNGQELHDDITASDERLKDISSDAFPYGLSDINKLTPIRFKYKDKTKNDWKLGLGAQTVQPIVPETVLDTDICIDGYNYDPDDHMKSTPKSDDTKLRMSYSQFIPILIKAVQELSAKVTALENA